MIASADHIVTHAIMRTELVGLAAGRNPLTGERIAPCTVGFLAGQADQDELDRNIAGTCKQFEISASDLGNQLFTQSFAGQLLHVATLNVHGHPEVVKPAVQWLEDFIARNAIDVLALASIMDFHDLDHAQDFHMGVVGRVLRTVALRSGCAIVLGNHLTKKGEVSGAPALIYTMRTTRIIVPMKAVEADKLYVPARDCGRYLRAETKIGPVALDDVWYRLDGDRDFVCPCALFWRKSWQHSVGLDEGIGGSLPRES